MSSTPNAERTMKGAAASVVTVPDDSTHELSPLAFVDATRALYVVLDAAPVTLKLVAFAAAGDPLASVHTVCGAGEV